MTPPKLLLITSSNSQKPVPVRYCTASIATERRIGTYKMVIRGKSRYSIAPNGINSQMFFIIDALTSALRKKALYEWSKPNLD